MATKRKKDVNPIDLREKITVYAPKGAPHHEEGEATQIHPVQKEKFLSMGFSETASKKDEKKGKEVKS